MFHFQRSILGGSAELILVFNEEIPNQRGNSIEKTNPRAVNISVDTSSPEPDMAKTPSEKSDES